MHHAGGDVIRPLPGFPQMTQTPKGREQRLLQGLQDFNFLDIPFKHACKPFVT